MIVEHRWRRENAEYWERKNITPEPGEPIFEMDTGRFKLGDGTTPYNELPYFSPGNGPVVDPDGTTSAELFAHVHDPTPHPVYDDGPSFVLLYQNAKV